MPKKQKPIDALMDAMDRCAMARGEATWTNGYRTASGKLIAMSEDARLNDKEARQWEYVDSVEKGFRRLALRLLREARDA